VNPAGWILALAIGLVVVVILAYLGVFRSRTVIPAEQPVRQAEWPIQQVVVAIPVGDEGIRRQVDRAVTIAGMPCDPRAPGAWQPESV